MGQCSDSRGLKGSLHLERRGGEQAEALDLSQEQEEGDCGQLLPTETRQNSREEMDGALGAARLVPRGGGVLQPHSRGQGSYLPSSIHTSIDLADNSLQGHFHTARRSPPSLSALLTSH